MPDSRMKESVRNFLVGLTSIVALLSLVVLLLLFGELERFLQPRYELIFHIDHAAGLRPGSTVELSGVPIGVVDEILVRPDDELPVRVVALIDHDVKVPARVMPYAMTSLLGGASILEVDTPVDSDDIPEPPYRFLPRDGTAVIEGPLKLRLVEQITRELDARMTPITSALQDFQELSETYVAFGKNLNEMVEAQSVEELEGGVAPNVRTSVRKLYAVLDEIQEAMVVAREWLGDEQLRSDARSAVNKANALIDESSQTLKQFTQLAAKLESDSDALVKRLLPVADELGATLEEVRQVAHLAREGQGTVGMMLNNPDLYNALEDAATRLDHALREVQLFLQKVRAEGLPVNF